MLKKFAGVETPCFVFWLSGRQVPINQVDVLMGSLINRMPYDVELGKSQSMHSLLHRSHPHDMVKSFTAECSLSCTHEAPDGLAPDRGLLVGPVHWAGTVIS